ncbi:hypothetical protein [Streptomyces sp. NPDC050504]|uniref:hypothetical protein n=1 Tax=Streptomyces sp. NPDC050504 TaxID=3365618 RepID=UPI00378FCFCC
MSRTWSKNRPFPPTCAGQRRPAWQSPYGPAPHRSRRARWSPVPGLSGALVRERWRARSR